MNEDLALKITWGGTNLKLLQNGRWDLDIWQRLVDTIRGAARVAGVEPIQDYLLKNGESHYVHCQRDQAVAITQLVKERVNRINQSGIRLEIAPELVTLPSVPRADTWRKVLDAGLLPEFNQMIGLTGWQLLEAGTDENGDLIVQPTLANKAIWEHFQAIMKESDG